MVETNLNTLFLNIINEKHFSHCRLCLKRIQEQYVRLEDHFHSNNSLLPLFNLLEKILEDEVLKEIPGLDAICMDCIDKAFEISKFIEVFQNSTQLLHKVFNNISETLKFNCDNLDDYQSLYITVKEHETELLLAESKKILKLQNSLSKCYTNQNSCQNGNQEHITRFLCKECGKSFKGLKKLKIHEAKHNTKQECPKCGKCYHTKDFFLRHVKLCTEGLLDLHPIRNHNNKPFSCHCCGKHYSTLGGLRVHNRFTHGYAKPHICKECGKHFTAPCYLKTHMIVHTGERNFICNICGNRFVSKEALLYHTRRHTGERPYSCKLCNEKFVNASARAEHYKFKHEGPTLMCEICSKKFVMKSFLRQHLNKHLNPSSRLYLRKADTKCTMYAKSELPIPTNT